MQTSHNSKCPVYFDVTDIIEYAMTHTTVTGIQRSALKIIESAVKGGGNRPIFGFLKHPITDTFKIADLSFMRHQYDLDDFTARFEIPHGKARWIARKLRRNKNRPIKRLVRLAGLQLRWMISPTLRAKLRSPEVHPRPSCLLDLKLAAGGAIVHLGAGWGTDYVGLHHLASTHGCKMIWFVHDIFPLTARPYTAFKDNDDRFSKWFDYINEHSDLIICNSNFTKSQIMAYRTGKPNVAPIAVARFPHEFKPSGGDRPSAIRPQIEQLLGKEYALCVGTIEIRKNILGLLHAWSAIYATRGEKTPMLVLAGSKGWRVADVFEYLDETNYIDGKVDIVYSPNDKELEHLYRNCLFTVFPSLFEGWGLPIGESLWFRKPVLCARNSSMPEVGGKYATYFDHAEPDSLKRALENMIDHPLQFPASIRNFLVSWADTSASILAAVDGQQAPRGTQVVNMYTLASR